MNIENISVFFIKADQIADHAPFVSTVSNLVNLFIKAVVIPISRQLGMDINSNRYFSYLDQKSYKNCLLLMIPIVGNMPLLGKWSLQENEERIQKLERRMEALR